MLDEVKKLTTELALPEYDVLLVGDGSGTVASKASGWSCWRYQNLTKKLTFHFGGSSEGTNNFAELIPYVNVLWLDYYEKHSLPRQVVIVSDSELTVRQGTGEYSRNANGILWNCLDYMRSMGYNIIWKHVKRNSNPLSALCDQHAGRMRKEMEGFRLTVTED